MLNAKTQTTKRLKWAKYILVLLTLIISLTACESDESVVENEIKRESKFSKVTFEELPSDIKTKDVFKLIKKAGRNNYQSVTKNTDSLNFQIDLNHIGLFENVSNTTITFKVINNQSVNNHFYNLVVTLDNNNTVLNSNLFRYEPSALSIHNGFSGRLVINSSHTFDTEVLRYFIGLQTKNSGSCITGVSGNWECSDGNNHSPSDVDRDNGPCRVGGNIYYIDVEYGPCPTAGEEEMSFDFDAGNPRNGGGGGISGGNNPCVPSLMADCGNGTMPIAGGNGDAISPLTTAFLNSLTLTLTRIQLQFINDPAQAALIEQIDNFLLEENHSPEAQAFAIEAIIAMEEDPNTEVYFDDKLINQLTGRAKCVFNILKGSSPTFSSSFIHDNFGSDKTVGVKLLMSDLSSYITLGGDGAAALTQLNYDANLNNRRKHKIVFDPNVLNTMSNLETALVLLHEIVHAELMERCIQLGMFTQIDTNMNIYNFSSNPPVGTSFEDNYYAYMVNWYNLNSANNSQWVHNLFTIDVVRQNLISSLLDGNAFLNDPIAPFPVSTSPLSSLTTVQIMESFSWNGLEETAEYQNLTMSQINLIELVTSEINLNYTKICTD